MSPARLAIQRICDERRVAPLELLSVLLDALQQSQTFHAGLAMSDPSHPQGAEGEIKGLCAMVNSEDGPKNLMGALRLAVFAYQLPAMINARDARSRDDKIDAASLERSVQVGDALRQLLQACIETVEEVRAEERPTIVEKAAEGFTGFRKGPPGAGIGELPLGE